MKSLAKIFFCGAAIFGMTVLFSSCTDTNEPEPGPEKTGYGRSVHLRS